MYRYNYNLYLHNAYNSINYTNKDLDEFNHNLIHNSKWRLKLLLLLVFMGVLVG